MVGGGARMGGSAAMSPVYDHNGEEGKGARGQDSYTATEHHLIYSSR